MGPPVRPPGEGQGQDRLRSRRVRFLAAIGGSLLLHVAVVAIAVGTSLWSWPWRDINVAITPITLESVAELPLGGAIPGREGEGDRPPAAGGDVAPSSPPEGTLATATPGPKPRPTRRRPESREKALEDEPTRTAGPPPKPTSVRSYGPEGSRVTALLRIDRIRGTPYEPALDELLSLLPDRRDLLDGTGIDLYRDIDALLIATPNPTDPTVTFLVARHRLSDGALRAALDRGAAETGRVLKWRIERGRPFAERRARSAGITSAGESHRGRRDERLVLLAAPHLAIVTPPAYRKLILGSSKRPHAAPGPGGEVAGHGGAGGADDRGAAGGSAGAPGATPVGHADDGSWAALLDRIDAEDSIMPADAAAMVSAVDLFSARTARQALGEARLFGQPAPRVVTVTIGVQPQPFANIDAEMADEAAARQWEEEWPQLHRRLLSNPLVVLSGFSGLVRRSSLSRDGTTVRLHVDSTEEETLRLFRLVADQARAFGG